MSRRVQQSQIFQKKRGKTSSFSRERHAFQIPQFITATPHDLNKLTHTATFLFESTSSTSYAKLLHYQPASFPAYLQERKKNTGYFSDCLWHRSCIPLAVPFLHLFIYLFSNFLQIFKHQKVKKKAKLNPKKKRERKTQREQESAPQPVTSSCLRKRTEVILDQVLRAFRNRPAVSSLRSGRSAQTHSLRPPGNWGLLVDTCFASIWGHLWIQPERDHEYQNHHEFYHDLQNTHGQMSLSVTLRSQMVY